jgi:hypothetical protein
MKTPKRMIDNRNIQTIAPFLAEDFVDFDQPDFDRDKYFRFIKENTDQLEKFGKYLIGKLHDSSVIDLEIKSDKLKMRLNDFSTHVFADAIVEKFKIDIDHDKLVFPIILELSGNLRVEFYRVNEKGDLETISHISIQEYMGEQILRLKKDRIEIAFELWHSSHNADLPGERILLLVFANELKLSEEQGKVWSEVFGNQFDGFYRYFIEQFESDRYVSDFSICLKLVDEYEHIYDKINRAQNAINSDS